MGNKYWSCDEIAKIDAQYYMPLSTRGVGKSYSITSRLLKFAYQSQTYQFAYLRRYKEDIKNDNVTSYFADIDVKKITNGDYNAVISKNGWLYFALIDDEMNIIFNIHEKSVRVLRSQVQNTINR